MRMSSVSSTIENGFVYLPEQADWLAAYLPEMNCFPNGKYNDQADSTSQALDWVKQTWVGPGMELYRWMEMKYNDAVARGEVPPID